MRTLPDAFEAEDWRLLCVLFLWFYAMSSSSGTKPPFLLRRLKEGKKMNERRMLCCCDDDGEWQALNRKQRWARLIAGLILLIVAGALPWSSAWILLAAITGWVGATHVLAAAMGYPGCPELGAVPSLLLRRSVKVGCVPWRWLDATLHLTRFPPNSEII
jgi:hypothetical protein